MNSQHPHGGSGGAPYDRERAEMEERHRAIQQHEEMARRDHERERERDRDRERERDSNELYQTTPHQHSSAGSIPIHQPVASRGANPIHSPGGILSNYNGGAQNPPLGGGGAAGSGSSAGPPPHGPVGGYSGPMPQSEQPGRQGQHGSQNAGSQHQMFGPMSHSQNPPGAPQTATGPSAAAAAAAVFGGPLPQQPSQQPQEGRGGQQGTGAFRGVTPGGQQPQAPAPPGAMNQGQQPILNVSNLVMFPLLSSGVRRANTRDCKNMQTSL